MGRPKKDPSAAAEKKKSKPNPKTVKARIKPPDIKNPKFASTYMENVHPYWFASLMRNGFSQKTASANMGISERTLRNWITKYPEMKEANDQHREATDAQVENALLRRALGYEYTEEKVIAEKTIDGRVIPLKVEKIKKVQQPDVVACVFWLQNRQPDKWKDRRVVGKREDAAGQTVESGVTQSDKKEFKEFLENDPAARKQIADIFVRQLTSGNAPSGKE